MKPYHVLSLLFAAASIVASSSRPRPVKRISHPSTLALDIVPRNPSRSHSHSSRRELDSDTDSLLHTDSFRLTIRAYDDTFHLHLRPNLDLIHPSARINYYSPQGEIYATEPLLSSSYRIYEGVVVHPSLTDERWKEDAAGGIASPARSDLGWARIIVHDDGPNPVYEGSFSVYGVIHHVQTRENYQRNRVDHDVDVAEDAGDLIIFRDIDIGDHHGPPGAKSCSHDSLEFNTNPYLNPVLAHSKTLRDSASGPWYDPRRSFDPINLDTRFGKRQGNDISGGNVTTNFIDRIGSHEGCSPTQSFVYMGVAADCAYVSKYGNTANATSQILSDWNQASSLYKTTFNVSMGIVELAVQDPTCPSTTNPSTAWNVGCDNSATLNDRLSLFSAWRGAKGGGDGAGLWHLMSGCPTGTEVGVAWLGQLCNTQASGPAGETVSGTGVSTATVTEWQVVAHEIGHNFGAIHDCGTGCTLTDPCCPASTTSCSSPAVFIMDAVSNVGEDTFSQCSVGNICASMQEMNITCLLPAGTNVPTISKQMCGNGIVETGEECDPGKGNTSPCCDSTTCKFINNAVCDPKSSDCCTNSCQFAPSSQVCRPARDPTCDTAETCTGTSSTCPIDKTTADGTSCGANGLACASGLCTSPDLQCQTVGSSLGLKKACPISNDKSCQVSCQDPSNSQSCIVLQATLTDGSPCGYGGKCEANVCKAGNAGDTIRAWYKQNLQISIPVTIAAAIVILLLLYRIGTAILACCRRNRAKKVAAYKASSSGRQRLSSWAPPQATTAAPSYEYPPRQAPRISSNGYGTPGGGYPPSHMGEFDQQRSNWEEGRTDDAYGDRSYRADSYSQSPPRQPPGWVDDRAYNGGGYTGGR